MGKGGANMGKLLKGKSREVKGDKKSKAAKPLTEGEFDTIKAVWDRQSRHLKAKIAEEQKNFKVNSRLVTTQMREQSLGTISGAQRWTPFPLQSKTLRK